MLYLINYTEVISESQNHAGNDTCSQELNTNMKYYGVVFNNIINHI